MNDAQAKTSPQEATTPAIFVSYKRDDLAQVQRLVQCLRSEGLDVWWDQDLAPDDPWEATIERQLDLSKVVIVAWSPAAVSSENVKAEARRARQSGKLLQTFVKPCDPPLFFGERQGVDISSWSGDSSDHRFQTVLTAALAILEGKKPPHGVGYVPRKHLLRKSIAVLFVGLSAVLGFLSNLGGARDALCSISSIETPCQEFGLTQAPQIEPTPDPDAIETKLRDRLLSGLNGLWSRQERDCSVTAQFAVETDEGGISRLRITADGFESLGQVVAAENTTVVTQATSPAPGESRGQWTYRLDGDRLVATDPSGVETTLNRCVG
ncbi:MAG TPA: toll/interleukin-1 receptor domain-containing protein [Hyphomonas sp.]|nr:hypothetical protein [Hyphomonas sp.]HRJ00612.1 toll/interleukin-1 receptor domain-containing protein [Hyphomonas sp.]HRK68342.1 toll/interleukin-1 receptor domain-containing protein [Hyphomonas sp.]